MTNTAAVVEGQVLASLERGLLAPERLQQVSARVAEMLQARQSSAGAGETRLKRRLADPDRKISRLLDSLEDGEGDMGDERQRKAEREEVLGALAEVTALSKENGTSAPGFAALCTGLVRNLEDSLRNGSVVQRAHELLARIIEKVTLTPDPETRHGLQLELHGSLAGVLFQGGLAAPASTSQAGADV